MADETKKKSTGKTAASKPKAKTEPKAKAASKVKPKSEPKAKAAAEKAKPAPEKKAAPKAAAASKAKAATKAAPADEAAPKPQPHAQPHAQPKTQPKTQPQAQPQTTALSTRSRRDELVSEINALLPELEDSSLVFLKQQAEVLLVKARKVKARQALRQYQQQGGPVAQDIGDVHVEQNEQGFFHIVARGARVFFNRDELREITTICWKAENKRAGMRGMYRWFDKERSDFLNDTSIRSPADPVFDRLYDEIRSKYKVKR